MRCASGVEGFPGILSAAFSTISANTTRLTARRSVESSPLTSVASSARLDSGRSFDGPERAKSCSRTTIAWRSASRRGSSRWATAPTTNPLSNSPVAISNESTTNREGSFSALCTGLIAPFRAWCCSREQARLQCAWQSNFAPAACAKTYHALVEGTGVPAQGECIDWLLKDRERNIVRRVKAGTPCARNACSVSAGWPVWLNARRNRPPYRSQPPDSRAVGSPGTSNRRRSQVWFAFLQPRDDRASRSQFDVRTPGAGQLGDTDCRRSRRVEKAVTFPACLTADNVQCRKNVMAISKTINSTMITSSASVRYVAA